MKLVFHGASVTHQGGDSGYTSHVFDFLSSKEVSCEKITYPACHFNDAGFYFSDSVIATKSDFVVFEWNTTGMSQYDQLKFEIVMQNFIRGGVTPCFLILPRINTTVIDGVVYTRESEIQIINFAKEYNLPILDLRNLNNLPELLKDEVHTNNLGAKVYAELVIQWILQFVNQKNGLNKNFGTKSSATNFNINLLNFGINFFDYFRFKAVKRGRLSEVGLTGMVGPFSPIIDIIINDISITNFSFFDPWCHYERRMTVSLINRELLDKYDDGVLLDITFKVLDKDPDYAIVKSDKFIIPEKKFVNIDSLIICDFDKENIHVDFI